MEEYVSGEWFEIVEEEEEDEEKVLYSCRMITLDIEFHERSVKITQDDYTRSNTIMCAHNLDGNRTQLTAEVSGLDWHNERLNMTSRLAYPYPN